MAIINDRKGISSHGWPAIIVLQDLFPGKDYMNELYEEIDDVHQPDIRKYDIIFTTTKVSSCVSDCYD